MARDCGPLDSSHRWFLVDDVVVCLVCDKVCTTRTVVTLDPKGELL